MLPQSTPVRWASRRALAAVLEAGLLAALACWASGCAGPPSQLHSSSEAMSAIYLTADQKATPVDLNVAAKAMDGDGAIRSAYALTVGKAPHSFTLLLDANYRVVRTQRNCAVAQSVGCLPYTILDWTLQTSIPDWRFGIRERIQGDFLEVPYGPGTEKVPVTLQQENHLLHVRINPYSNRLSGFEFRGIEFVFDELPLPVRIIDPGFRGNLTRSAVTLGKPLPSVDVWPAWQLGAQVSVPIGSASLPGDD